jgi:NAD-dependent deacetylase
MVAPNNSENSVAQVAELLRDCNDLLFITGAGISADSGLPTYRGVGGLYDVDTTAEGFSIEEILSGEMLRESPQLTWKCLMQIRSACRGATFNRAHQVLVEMEQHFDRVCIVTQNVDGFHSAAGSRNVIDLHGNLNELVCTQCDFRERVEDQQPVVLPPRCPRCEAVLRPDVVLFGEMLPGAKTERLYHELRSGFDAVFSIGTSSAFHYIAWPIQLANDTGKLTVEINPGVTEVSQLVDVRIPLRASVALDAIWTRFKSAW